MVMIKFFLILLFSSGISLVGKTQSFSVSDSLRFSQDSTTVWLSLTFSKPLSQDTLYYEQNLPFSFFILSPKDSIRFERFTTNFEFTEYELEFKVKKNTYFSILSLNIKSVENEFLPKPFLVNFRSTQINQSDLEYKKVTAIFTEPLTKVPFTTSVNDYHIFTVIFDKRFFNNYKFTPIDSLDFFKDIFLSNIQNCSQVNYSGILYIDNSVGYIVDSLQYEKEAEIIVACIGIPVKPINTSDFVVAIRSVLINTGHLSTNEWYPKYAREITYSKFSTLTEFVHELVNIQLEEHLIYLLPIKNITEKLFISNSFLINSVYPNPFNPTTTLTFSVTNSSSISFSVYDILGRRIQSLEHKDVRYSAGTHSFMYDFSGLPSGTYFIEAIGTELGSGHVSRQVAKVSLVK
jgi:hypothetical protein